MSGFEKSGRTLGEAVFKVNRNVFPVPRLGCIPRNAPQPPGVVKWA